MTAANFNAANGSWRSGPVSGPYPRAAARHTTDQLTILGDELIVLAGVEGNGRCSNFAKYTSYEFTSHPRASHYNFATKTWEFHAAEGGREWPGTAYDPISKSIVLVSSVGLEIYNPVTRTKTRAVDLSRVTAVKDERGNPIQNPLRYNNTLVYFPPNEKLYYFESLGRTVYEIALNRNEPARSTITRLNTTGTAPPTKVIGYAYEPVKNRILGGPVENRFYAFDPLSKSWTVHAVQGGAPGTVAFHTIDYDPVNNVFIFVSDESGGRRTWAYRYAR
jgi:hypothetical protein